MSPTTFYNSVSEGAGGQENSVLSEDSCTWSEVGCFVSSTPQVSVRLVIEGVRNKGSLGILHSASQHDLACLSKSQEASLAYKSAGKVAPGEAWQPWQGLR